MTQRNEIDFDNDKRYLPYLDYGFVGLRDAMGDDYSIVEAARTSYGKGTKGVSNDRTLIRYLMRNHHTSVFEMVEFKFHLKMPIFVARQHIRHRTASVNEYSARYSIMSDEFYIPELDRLQSQSKTNNQGSDEALVGLELEMVDNTIKRISKECYQDYLTLINDENGAKYNIIERKGLSRELARMVLPVNIYTEMYWKINLKNLLHYINLRADGHAQYEINLLANAMAKFVKQRCPIAWEAFEDYILNGVNLSSMESKLVELIVHESNQFGITFKDAFAKLNSKHDGKICENYRLSQRESKEFKTRWNL